ncbi:MAG: hypothetical protein EZS28_047018, partial [Streblomastix strix]
IKFTMLGKAQYLSGGTINAQLSELSSNLKIIDCTFTGCKTFNQGGALRLQISNGAETILEDVQFNQCEADSGGGALWCSINKDANLTLSGSCLFTDCKSNASGGGCYFSTIGSKYQINLLGNIQFEGCVSKRQGGGLHIDSSNDGQITINAMKFSNCNSTSNSGGGQCLQANGSGIVINITGKVSFDNCFSVNSHGGGQYLCVNGSGIIINITGQLEYKQCSANTGGGLYVDVQNNVTIDINKASFIDCYCIYYGGGGLHVQITSGKFSISGTASFLNCNSSLFGGGIYLNVDNGTVNFNPTEQILIENCNGLQNGGGIFSSITNKGLGSLNNMKFNKCNSKGSGGGIYANIESGGQLTLDKQCIFYQCQSYKNGGGIYVRINFTAQCSFIIKDVFIHKCKALNNELLQFRNEAVPEIENFPEVIQ